MRFVKGRSGSAERVKAIEAKIDRNEAEITRLAAAVTKRP